MVRRLAAIFGAAALALAGLPGTAHATATECLVDYQILWQESGGFAAQIVLVNLGDPVTGWTMFWQMNPDEQLGVVWDASMRQAGTWVVADSVPANADLATGASADFGWTALAVRPTTPPPAFWMNGALCQIVPPPG